MAVPTFIDGVVLHISAGRGGNGVASVHREKFKPLGGPDGGNGGPGGSVILRVDPDVTTLVDYHHESSRRAGHGGHGAGSNRNGAHGDDLVLPVPDGTVVTDEDGQFIADLVGAGTEVVIAQGGRGGLGNAALASSKRRAPGFALLGEPGEERTIGLELKVVADVGLVGFPSGDPNGTRRIGTMDAAHLETLEIGRDRVLRTRGEAHRRYGRLVRALEDS